MPWLTLFNVSDNKLSGAQAGLSETLTCSATTEPAACPGTIPPSWAELGNGTASLYLTNNTQLSGTLPDTFTGVRLPAPWHKRGRQSLQGFPGRLQAAPWTCKAPRSAVRTRRALLRCSARCQILCCSQRACLVRAHPQRHVHPGNSHAAELHNPAQRHQLHVQLPDAGLQRL